MKFLFRSLVLCLVAVLPSAQVTITITTDSPTELKGTFDLGGGGTGTFVSSTYTPTAFHLLPVDTANGGLSYLEASLLVPNYGTLSFQPAEPTGGCS
jgi:hypothetical protein